MRRRQIRFGGQAGARRARPPGLAHAQSAIIGWWTGHVGGGPSGCDGQAASDALIEKSNAVVTDGEGVYRIVDLRPGTYVVTFTLPGFKTFRREGIAAAGGFTATINADLRVGALEETDHGHRRRRRSSTCTTAVHTAGAQPRSDRRHPDRPHHPGHGQLVVGINLSLPDTGGARAMQQTYMSTHGMTAANTTVLVDGMMVNGLQADGAVQSYFNDAMNQEVSYQTSGIGAETSAGGVRLNMIPREGGNRFSGDFKTAYRPGAWQSTT